MSCDLSPQVSVGLLFVVIVSVLSKALHFSMFLSICVLLFLTFVIFVRLACFLKFFRLLRPFCNLFSICFVSFRLFVFLEFFSLSSCLVSFQVAPASQLFTSFRPGCSAVSSIPRRRRMALSLFLQVASLLRATLPPIMFLLHFMLFWALSSSVSNHILRSLSSSSNVLVVFGWFAAVLIPCGRLVPACQVTFDWFPPLSRISFGQISHLFRANGNSSAQEVEHAWQEHCSTLPEARLHGPCMTLLY